MNVAQSAMKEAEDYLAELLSCPGSGHGALFWIERELTEKVIFFPPLLFLSFSPLSDCWK